VILRLLEILFGAAFTVAVCLALGRLLLRWLRAGLRRQEEHFFAFVTGAACLSLGVFLLAVIQAAYRSVFLALGLVALAAAIRLKAHKPAGEPLPPASRAWRALFWLAFAVFTCVYFVSALAPEASPDGSQYHLGLVSRYLGAHGFYHVSSSMYSYLSQGAELLYLFAFAFGEHSSAALVHFAFLVALPFGMMFYARRFGFAAAGVAGALLVYLSPMVGYDGTTAYIDVAVACVLFALFYALQVWDEERRPGLLAVIGLLAGFAYAMKYTAFLAIPYAVGFVAWKTYRARRNPARPLALVALCALAMVAPWVLKNWIQTGNPFAPFYNQWFPNPWVHIGLEQAYRSQLAHWGGFAHFWQTPLEVTVGGDRLQGFLGVVFLLAPIALLALRFPQGRQLLLAAALFLSTYPWNIGTRFLISPLPFVALAMGLVLVRWKAMVPLVVAMHALTSWPPITKAYCDRNAVRLDQFPIAAALRIEPEQRYLERRKPDYAVARMVEQEVPPQARVFALSAPPAAYCSREVLGSYECAWSNNLFDMVRMVETAARSENQWSITEFRVFDGRRELPREPQWRLRAHPNSWEVQMAFDNSLVTRWRSWQPLFKGEWVEVDFGRSERIDAVVLDATPNQPDVRLQLEGQGEEGSWRVLAGEPHTIDVPEPAALRRLITRELRWEGIEYLLAFDSDPVAPDMRARTAEWGLVLIAERNGARLYRVE
jgi:hypothetical protein